MAIGAGLAVGGKLLATGVKNLINKSKGNGSSSASGASKSGGGSPSQGSSGGGRTVQAGSDGNAPSGTRVGDTVNTAGGAFRVVEPGTRGATYNPASGLWSIKVGGQAQSAGAAASGAGRTSSGTSGMSQSGTGGGYSQQQETVPSATGSAKYTDENGERKQGLYTSDPTRYSTIQQMRQLSERWHDADEAERKRLASRAQALGTSLGATRDDSGTWWYDGQPLYSTQYEAPEIPNAWEGYTDVLKDYQSSQEDLVNRQIDAAIEQAREKYGLQKEQVDQQYDDLARQLYIQRRMSERDLPEQMAAMGYNGGITESTALGIQTGYQDALREGETERINAIAQIEGAIRQAELSGDLERARQLSSVLQDIMSLYASGLGQIQSGYNLRAQMGYQAGQDALDMQKDARSWSYQEIMDERERQQAQEETSYGRTLELAKMAAAYGDFSLFRQLGFTDEQIAQMRAMWQLQTFSSGSGGSGRSGGRSRSGGSQGSLQGAAATAVDDSADGVDLASVIKLGRGPISGGTLAALADSGQVSLSTDADGTIHASPGANSVGGYSGVLRDRLINGRKSAFA